MELFSFGFKPGNLSFFESASLPARSQPEAATGKGLEDTDTSAGTTTTRFSLLPSPLQFAN